MAEFFVRLQLVQRAGGKETVLDTDETDVFDNQAEAQEAFDEILDVGEDDEADADEEDEEEEIEA